jgi:hypothetical protein
MTLQEALHTLGVRDNTLSKSEKAHLDTKGYLPLPGILTSTGIAQISSAMEKVYALEKTGQNGGPAESSYMQNKAAGFDICFTHPRVLAAICHVLDGHIKSFGVHGRPQPPGGEQQALHVDYNGPAAKPGRYAVCNSIWMLTDFTQENGATRIIPGSYLSGKIPKEELEDPAATHPDQQLLLGPAGTVVVFNSHMWHGTTHNRSDHNRHSLTGFFCRRDDPHMVFSSALSQDASARLSEAARCLFADPEPWTE